MVKDEKKHEHKKKNKENLDESFKSRLIFQTRNS